MNRRVFFAFLGTSDYVPVHYTFRGERSASPEIFVQAAILDHLQRQHGDLDVRIGLTDEARRRHWSALQARLASHGNRLSPFELDLRDPRQFEAGPEQDERWLWSFFEQIGAGFGPGDEVHFDITHGFRSFPVVALLALTFFSRVRGFTLGGVYYGAFESLLRRALPAPDGITFDTLQQLQSWCRDGQKEYRRSPHTAAPIFDLTAMYALTEWTDGVAQWEHIGRADALVAHAKPLTAALRAQLRKETPKSLAAFPDALGDLSNTLTSVRHDRIAGAANRVLQLIDGMSEEARAHPSLTPLRALNDSLRANVSELAVPFAAPKEDWSGTQALSDTYLRHQCAVARWLGTRRRVVEAFTVLRETITSCAARIAVDAGLASLGDDLPDTAVYRGLADGWALVATGCVGSAKRPSHATLAAECDYFCEQLLADTELSKRFQLAAQRVTISRNRYDHAWSGREHSQVGASAHDVARALESVVQAVDAVSALVDAVIARVPQGPWSRRQSGIFLNLSNHPITSWSQSQTDAARALGLGEPTELEGSLALVPALASVEAVSAMADDLARRATAQGARGAMVATDFTLTVALVRALQARGIRCFSASTERNTQEFHRDGETVKESIFRFVQWREYPR